VKLIQNLLKLISPERSSAIHLLNKSINILRI